MPDPEPKPDQTTAEALLGRIARDIQAMRSDFQQVINHMRDAEKEIPERVRRFTMYFHDVRDFVDMHRTLGQEPPDYILREIERCSDRFRHILEDMYSDNGAFEKVRQEMAGREGNRYDHTRLLQKGTGDETRNG